ncbi:MAG TPA: GreA/GreB family elongation factor [Mycobacterium sp.]|nr:GreA/GreB family elongation factor [Mycobacterium sp.]
MSDEHEAMAFSSEERDQIINELAQLRQRRDRLAAAFEGDQDTVGDRGDAADALQRADDVAAIDDQIRRLNWLLDGGVAAAASPGRLPDGTELTVRFPADRVVRLRVVAVVEETPAGEQDTTLTADSPLGLALAGHHPGDTVSYSTPQGRQHVELLEVRYPS